MVVMSDRAVYDVEYAFGAHDYSTTGIFEVEPKECPGFTFRKSILIGRTSLSPNEVMLLMEDMAGEYTGDTYHLITRNCNHFCNDACVSLTGNRIPRWVNRLAKFGLLFNCVFPTNVHPEKVRCRSEDSISGIERKKLNNSIKFVTSPLNDTYITAKAVTRSRRRCASLSAPPLLSTSSIMNLEQLLCQA